MIPLGTISQQTPAVAPTAKIMAINGHPGMTDAYNNSPSGNPAPTYYQQVDWIKQMGFQWYRFGVVPQPDGSLIQDRITRQFETPTGPATGIVPMCADNSIPVLIVIQDRLYNDPGSESPLWLASNQEIYDAGFLLASGFASTYGSYFTHYELGNEYELFRHLKANTPNLGTQPEHYVSVRHLEVVGHYVRGMDAGIKSVNPNAKTIFNTATYSAWLVFDTVFNIAPGVDIIGAHIYDDMLQGTVSSVIGPDYDFVGYMHTTYGRPVWITETNYRYRSGNSEAQNQQGQVDWWNNFILPQQSQPGLGATFIHALIADAGVDKTFDEKNYGLVGFNDYATNGYTQPVARQLATQLGLVI